MKTIELIRDRDGKEIQVNDVLIDLHGKYRKVAFDKKEKKWLVKKGKDANYLAAKNYFKIVGNIRQNPYLKELIK